MRWSLATIALVPRGGTAYADRAERGRVFEWAAGAGFAGVEVSPHWLDIVGLQQSEMQQVRDEALAVGLAVAGVNINRCILTRHRRAQEHLALLHRAVEAANWLQAPLVTLSLSMPLGSGPAVVRGCDFLEIERKETADCLGRLAEYAGERDIQLSLELHDDGMLDTAGLCLDMVSRVRAENVGVNPDLGNLVRSTVDADWRETLQWLAPHANNWHVKNYRQGRPSPVWDGDIDYVAAFQIMRAAGYDGWVSIESYFDEVLDLQTRSLAYLMPLAAIERPAATKEGSAA
jgi:sugar phosphate isomerase/epimerase